MKKLSLAAISLLSLMLFSCEQTPLPLPEPTPSWQQLDIERDIWLTTENKGESLALISDEQYLELDREGEVLRQIDFPQYTFDRPQPIVSDKYLVLGYTDYNVDPMGTFITKVQDLDGKLEPVMINHRDYLPNDANNLRFYGPIGAINDRDQLLMNYHLVSEKKVQYLLFDINVQNDSLALSLARSFSMPGQTRYDYTEFIKSVGSSFLIQPQSSSDDASIYLVDASGEPTKVLSGELYGYFECQDTLFASVGGQLASNDQYIHYSVDGAKSWQPYFAGEELGPFSPKLAVGDIVVYSPLNRDGLFYTNDFRTEKPISMAGLPENAYVGLMNFYEGQYVLVSGGYLYRRTSLDD